MKRPSRDILIFLSALGIALFIGLHILSIDSGPALSFSTPSRRVGIGLTPGKFHLLSAHSAAADFQGEGLDLNCPTWSPDYQPLPLDFGLSGFLKLRTEQINAYASPFASPNAGWTSRSTCTATVISLTIPFWLLGTAVPFICLGIFLWPAKRPTSSGTVACPQCAYDLRGYPHRCPECGWLRPLHRPMVMYARR